MASKRSRLTIEQGDYMHCCLDRILNAMDSIWELVPPENRTRAATLAHDHNGAVGGLRGRLQLAGHPLPLKRERNKK